MLDISTTKFYTSTLHQPLANWWRHSTCVPVKSSPWAQAGQVPWWEWARMWSVEAQDYKKNGRGRIAPSLSAESRSPQQKNESSDFWGGDGCLMLGEEGKFRLILLKFNLIGPSQKWQIWPSQFGASILTQPNLKKKLMLILLILLIKISKKSLKPVSLNLFF